MTDQKKHNVSIEDVYNLIKHVNENLTSKIESCNEDIKTLSNAFEKELEVLTEKVVSLEDENRNLKKRLLFTERKLRKNNLVFYGLKENTEETENSLVAKILDLLKEKLCVELKPLEITNAFRLGKKSGKIRPILVEFLCFFTKKEILSNCSKLKGTNIFVAEDLIEEDREERRCLVQNLKVAKEKNKEARIKGNTLVIEGKVYKYEDLIRTNGDGYYFPPAPRRTISEASTPITTVPTEDEIETIGVEKNKGNEEKERTKTEIIKKSTGAKQKIFISNTRSSSRNRK